MSSTKLIFILFQFDWAECSQNKDIKGGYKGEDEISQEEVTSDRSILHWPFTTNQYLLLVLQNQYSSFSSKGINLIFTLKIVENHNVKAYLQH